MNNFRKADSPRERRDHAFLQSLYSGALVRLFTLGLALLTVSISAKALGSANFGVLATLGTVVGLTGFADLGLGLGLMTSLAQSLGSEKDNNLKALVSSALISLGGLGVAIAILGSSSVFYLPWPTLLGSPNVPKSTISLSVIILSISIGIAIPASIGQRVLLGIQKGAVANSWILLSAVLQFAAVLAVAILDGSIWMFVVASISLPIFVNILESVWVFKKYSHLKPENSSVSVEVAKKLLRLGALFFILNVAVAAAYQSDTIVVSAVLGASSAAIFAIALRLFGAASGLLASSLQQFWPSLIDALVRSDLDWARKRFRQVLIYTTGILISISIVIVLFGQEFAKFWVGNSLVPSIGLLFAFALWTVYSNIMTQLSTLLNAGGIVLPQVAMAVAMVSVNIPLSIILTRRFGLVGPLYGSLLAHILCEGFPMVLFSRKVLRDGIVQKNK